MIMNLQDPQTWVAISFLLFFLLFGKVIWKKLISFLDAKINIIRSEIKEAKELHEEAKTLLANEKKKVQDLENQVKRILEESKKVSQEMILKNKTKIEEEINKLEKEAEQKIYYLEQSAIEEIRAKISEEALKATVTCIKSNMSKQIHSALLNSTLKEVELDIKKNKVS